MAYDVGSSKGPIRSHSGLITATATAGTSAKADFTGVDNRRGSERVVWHAEVES